MRNWGYNPYKSSEKTPTYPIIFQTDIFFQLVVSNIFYFHPHLGKVSNLTNIFQMAWNHQLVLVFHEVPTFKF